MKIRKTIRKVLKEGIVERVIDLIDSHGLESAISFVGGWEELKSIVGEEYISTKDMIRFIKDLVRRHQGGISIFDFDEDPIFYGKTDDEYKEIVYFGESTVTVQVWNSISYDNIGDFHVGYESLNDDTIVRVFEFLVEQYEKGIGF